MALCLFNAWFKVVGGGDDQRDNKPASSNCQLRLLGSFLFGRGQSEDDVGDKLHQRGHGEWVGDGVAMHELASEGVDVRGELPGVSAFPYPAGLP